MFNYHPLSFETDAKRRALVVDDDFLTRECVSAVVSMLGFQVVQARDGQEAVARYLKLKGTVRLVIMDISMPVLDGVQAMHGIRNVDPNAKIILCSGDPEAERVGSGADGFISKPFRGQTICAVVERVLQATGQMLDDPADPRLGGSDRRDRMAPGAGEWQSANRPAMVLPG